MEQPREIVVPLRRDGTPKVFWYDSEMPGHILYRYPDGHLRLICMGQHR